MIIKTGIGLSIHQDAAEGARRAVEMAFQQNPEPDVAIVFGSIWHDQAAVVETVSKCLRDNICLKGVRVIGCSSFVEFSSAGVTEKSIMVVLLSSSHIKFHLFTQEVDSGDSRGSARKLMEQVAAHDAELLSGRSVGLFLPNVYAGNCVEYLEGIKEHIGNRLPLVGGGCSNLVFKNMVHDDYLNNYQYFDDSLLMDNINLLVLEPLDDRVKFSFAYNTLWTPVVAPVKCTRADTGTIFEVGGIPVVDYYKKYLGDDFIEKLGGEMLYRYPFLLLYETSLGEKSNVICVFDFDQSTGSAQVYPPLNLEGQNLQLVCLNREDLVLGACEAARAAREALDGYEPELCIIFNCQLRRRLLHATVQKEISSIISVLGSQVPLFGFYAMGEFGPLFNRYEEVVDPENPFGGTFPLSTSTSVLMIGAKGETDAEQIDFKHNLQAKLKKEKLELSRGREVEYIKTLKTKLDESEDITFKTEMALKQINRQNYEMGMTIKRQYEELARLHEYNVKLQAIIKQHTPVTVWEKAGFFSRQGALTIPDEELQLTMMFLDIKGFTSFAEKHTAHEVIQGINEIFGPATDIIYQYKGDVDKFIGDCIFAIFPDPLPAVRSAVDIQDLMRDTLGGETPFSIRIGINCGRVVSGNVGSENRSDNTLIGDAVNTAQRLESNCTPGRILLSDECYRSVKDSMPENITSVESRQISVKGKKDLVTVHELSLAIDV